MSKIRTVLTPASPEVGPLDLAGLAVSAGCGAIALTDGPELCGEVLGEVRALGVSIEFLALACSEPLGDDSLAGLISRAAELEIPHILVPAGPGEYSYSQTYDQLYSLLYRIAPRADELAVKLLVCAPQKAFLLSPLELRSLIDAINSPNVGCCLSFEHCRSHGLCIAHWLEILNARVFACQLSSASDMVGEVLALWRKIPAEPFCLTTKASIAEM